MEILKQNKIHLLILLIILSWLTCVICNSTGLTKSLIVRMLLNRRQENTVKEFTKTPKKTVRRTIPYRPSLEEQCDYEAVRCSEAYNTGRVCGRTLFYKYETFKSYCMLDYVNCREKYDVWQILHMGHCFKYWDVTEFNHTEYTGDGFLDTDYVRDDLAWNW